MIVGLTGSIATGKSEVSRLLRERGIPVFDADAAVHELYRQGPVVAEVERLFPGVAVAGSIDRGRLAAALAARPDQLAQLEALVHPLVQQERKHFLATWEKAPVVVLDIPLLFETGGDKEVDAIIVVTTTPELQRKRALARPGMTAEKLALILSRQMPMAEKASRADYVIDNSGSLDDLAHKADQLVEWLQQPGRKGKR